MQQVRIQKGIHKGVSQSLWEKFQGTSKGPSPIYDHQSRIGHSRSVEDYSIVGREVYNYARTIKESIYTRDINPTLNKNTAKYNLPHIWDRVLLTTPELKIKNQQEQT